MGEKSMRKIIIDTDTGSDDAVALVMALRDPSVRVLAFTTVSGNINVDQATYNALQSIEYANTYKPPVYKGIARPLCFESENASQVHGIDGMGDVGFRAPNQKEESEHAVDALIRIIGAGDGDIELITIGPLTNIAVAMLQAPEVMRKIPHITIMGGANFFSNPHTPCAEFNIMADPDAAAIVCDFGVPFTMVTLEACQVNGAPLTDEEIDQTRAAGETAAFCMDCNCTTYDLAEKVYGYRELELPDPVTYAVFSNPDLIKTSFSAETHVERGGTYTRGTTVFRKKKTIFEERDLKINSTIVTEVHGQAYKAFQYDLIKD
jgi:purine nucleosidase